MGVHVFTGIPKQCVYLSGRIKRLQRDLAQIQDRRGTVEAESSALAERVESSDTVPEAQGHRLPPR